MEKVGSDFFPLVVETLGVLCPEKLYVLLLTLPPHVVESESVSTALSAMLLWTCIF